MSQRIVVCAAARMLRFALTPGADAQDPSGEGE